MPSPMTPACAAWAAAIASEVTNIRGATPAAQETVESPLWHNALGGPARGPSVGKILFNHCRDFSIVLCLADTKVRLRDGGGDCGGSEEGHERSGDFETLC
ncbi:hypothetical protein J1614_007399 [Plenodomus biglobosus]|nr:hypothetical protein J1614_007399 [Plenodomus biglobosus]